ncbi:unnamed protein product [Cuscuta epithymum]|uniref:BED-type domain-containing protein n=1 Tax=Cuscuta epithymum TaxID=186058 RepID=A0AAV0FPZ7_9ASTE|nr:unnamed protein product [Cuscuta epithymum]
MILKRVTKGGMEMRCPKNNYYKNWPDIITAFSNNNKSRRPLTKMSLRMKMRRKWNRRRLRRKVAAAMTPTSLPHPKPPLVIKKSKSELMKNNFDKWKDAQTGYWHATCKWCNKNYSLGTSGGYGSTARHLKAKHPVEYAKLGGGTGKQTQISRFANSQPFGNFSYNDAQNLTGMANLIVEENLPYMFSESLALSYYACGSLNPQFRGYSRKTVKKEIIKLYKAEKARLQIFFANFDGRVTIYSDIWEDDFHHLNYLGLTAHYIDEDWNMHKRVLAFREFNDRHTAEHIYILIERILIEYNLIDKVFAIGFDNATNNTVAIPRLRELCGVNTLMGRFFHQRCACHVINLCVQDGLKALGDAMKVVGGGGGG